MSKSFAFFSSIVFILIILGSVIKGEGLSYFSDDIICKYKVPITCGIKRTLLCIGKYDDFKSRDVLRDCQCRLDESMFKYGYKIYLSEKCDGVISPMNGYELVLLGMRIDINQSTREDLMYIDGIGEVVAGNIVFSRIERGEFERVEDLLRIKGIGKKTLDKIRKYLCVNCRK